MKLKYILINFLLSQLISLKQKETEKKAKL